MLPGRGTRVANESAMRMEPIELRRARAVQGNGRGSGMIGQVSRFFQANLRQEFPLRDS